MRRTLAFLLLFNPLAVAAQKLGVPVLMLSDIHFDPFHNPSLAPQLADAEISRWPAILATVSSPADEAAYQKLQDTCGARSADTDYALMTSTVAAAQKTVPAPLFITVSGDLTVHQFDCRFHTVFEWAGMPPPDFSSFAAKVVAFVAQQLQAAYPRTPIYMALGNNDTSCGDYGEDESSRYLQKDAITFSELVLDKKNKAAIAGGFPLLGDYAVTLPRPFKHTSLLVLQDLFESRRYETCAQKKSPQQGAAQIAWLTKQLDTARRKKQHVWIMAHIPPGIDAYSTFLGNRKDATVCAGAHPVPFLNSDLFADTLAAYTDVISLVLLGHTHTDEMRLYLSAADAQSGTGAIPGKLVPSVTPVHGNYPAFTAALADPRRALLKDFTVYQADNLTGIAAHWTPEYTYSSTYHQPDYSAASLTALTTAFRADPESKSPLSKSYEQFYFVNDPAARINLQAMAMKAMWPTYTCSLTLDHAKDFSACACPSSPAAP